jgi:hypothetical protein
VLAMQQFTNHELPFLLFPKETTKSRDIVLERLVTIKGKKEKKVADFEWWG